MRDKPLILIIDDEADMRDIVRIKLQSAHFAIEEAASGKEGLEKAAKFLPDVILLDVEMPEMDGVETFYKLQENPQTKNIKILFFTGKRGPTSVIIEANRRFGKEVGSFDYLRKEIDLDDLVKRLQYVCDNATPGAET